MHPAKPFKQRIEGILRERPQTSSQIPSRLYHPQALFQSRPASKPAERLNVRIAILGPYFWPQGYGIEKVMYAHAKYLAARGHEVHVVTSRLQFPDGINSDLPAFEAHESFFIRRLNVLWRAAPPFINYPSRGGLILAGLQRTLRTLRPEVVHAHNIGAGAWAFGGALYAQKSKAPFFYSAYHHSGKGKFDGVRKSLSRALNYFPLRTASKIYHQTSRDFETFPADYRYAPIDRFAVLLNGVEPPASSRKRMEDDSPLNMLFVGRVDDVRKGFAVLEASLDALSDEVRRRFILTVVGSVSDLTRSRLESKYGDAMRVRGPISELDLEQAYADADVFVMPSLYEGFGMPYIEAMRYGVPVIGTTAGGVPEVVPAETGLLAPPGNIDELALAITQLVTEPQLRLRMGLAGAKWSRRFHWNSIIDGLEADYQRSVDCVGLSPSG